MYYLICETLSECPSGLPHDRHCSFAAAVTPEEWPALQAELGLSAEDTPVLNEKFGTRADAGLNALTGCFSLPDPMRPETSAHSFSFIIAGGGAVFIDRSGFAADVLSRIARTKKWKEPGLERFLYDFLEILISDDRSALEKYDETLNSLEESVMKGRPGHSVRVYEIRRSLLRLRRHYVQLIDLAQEFLENENSLFQQKNLRYFRLFIERATRLSDTSQNLADTAARISSLIQSQMDARQNSIMTVLTVITAVFAPLTLITGWYGMNFRHMPELEWTWGYPAVFVLCAVIAVGCLVWFRKKKWL
jgi:magnesium transporter